jgi:nucleotide-binding universal stress UspA family protein
VLVTRPPVQEIPWVSTVSLPPLALGKLQRDLTSQLERCVRIPDAADVDLAVRVQQAPSIHQEILAQSGVLQSDLIVMGTHGLGGFDRWVLGSVTEKILRKAQVPILVVPPHAAAAPSTTAPGFKRILCAVDFSAGSNEALAYAVSLAEETDGKLTLLHVIDDAPMYQEPISTSDVLAAKRSCVERLEQLVPDDARIYCDSSVHVTVGEPKREILKTAEERAAELIVVGVHGRNAIDRLVFGSTTSAVIRTAICPVLAVRCPQPAVRRAASSGGAS